jgi:hypothetical protein
MVNPSPRWEEVTAAEKSLLPADSSCHSWTYCENGSSKSPLSSASSCRPWTCCETGSSCCYASCAFDPHHCCTRSLTWTRLSSFPPPVPRSTAGPFAAPPSLPASASAPAATPPPAALSAARPRTVTWTAAASRPVLRYRRRRGRCGLALRKSASVRGIELGQSTAVVALVLRGRSTR